MRVLLILFPFAWRNLWRNWRRTLITLLVVSIGVWSILTFNALIRAWSDSSLKGSLKNMTAQIQLHAPGYLDDPDMRHSFTPAAALLARLDGPDISHWAPRVRIPAIVQSEYKTLPISLVGIEPAREAGLSFIADCPLQGARLLGDKDPGVLIGRHLAERLKTRLGKRLVVMANDAEGKLQERGVVIKGIYAASQPLEDSLLFIGLEQAQHFAHAGGQISEIALMTREPPGMASVLAKLKAAAPALDIQGWDTLEPMTKGIHDLTQGFIYVWLWVMFVLIAIGVVNTQLMAVFERTREFGLLQALGFRPSWIMLEVLLEAVQIIGFGVLLGAISAYLTVYALKDGISLEGLSAGADFLGIERVLYPRLELKEFVTTVLVVWGLGVLTALWPARRATRFNAIEAMRST
ncbi:ABC transporter permease [Gallaecimonas kandeliae]|uniref:ABC transporter permease n=1 Tax=Gallaecimonas kandeliae TaxID=3029055 RepID=UPI002648CBD0|nr:FtsX-like permease family protein [Gallaecimonas kandeliae]WKE65250.1 ABC transporter permease [Gallaecimonas kandeliae]